MRGIMTARNLGAELPQRRDVIQDPKRSAMSSNNNIVAMNDKIADRSRRQIHLQRLPMITVVPGNIHGALGASKKQSLAFYIFAHRVDGLVIGQAAEDRKSVV